MFVVNYPAMVIKKTLIIADLHLGITSDLYKSGFSLPNQAVKMAEKLNKLKKITKTQELVILGDIKHKVSGTTRYEEREISEFLQKLKFKEIILIKGNHDGFLEKYIPKNMKKKTKIKKTHNLGNYHLSHGHRIVKTNKTLVIGHNQPHIKFRDDVGSYYIEPVWIKGITKDKKKVIIVPAFNELCGATIMNQDEFLGPIAKKLVRSRTHAYLLDGTDLGTLKNLELD